MSRNCGKLTTGWLIIWFLVVIFMSFTAGCGDFFAEKPTELESKKILQNLSTFDVITDEDRVRVAEFAPPKIIDQKVHGIDEAKLFYFAKYHTSAELVNLINDQFAVMLRDAKGKTSVAPNYTISHNPATNQVIARCPSKSEAQQILAFLKEVDVPPVQVKIDCLISEVYADVTMDWETTILIEELFGENFTLGGKIIEGQLQPAFPGAAIRDAARASFGLQAGYNDGKDFQALVDMLVSRGYLKILMNPSLEVVNGQTARILSSEHVPLQKITTVYANTDFTREETEYVDVIDSLEITPHVFADGYIGLETSILLGSKSTPEGVAQTPIVTKREITNKENRIRTGQSLVIGGLRKTEKRSVIRGVPFLKDLPMIGILFSSKDFEERGKEVLFIITPTISTGGEPHKDVMRRIQESHSDVYYKRGLTDVILNPFMKQDPTRSFEGSQFEITDYNRIHKNAGNNPGGSNPEGNINNPNSGISGELQEMLNNLKD